MLIEFEGNFQILGTNLRKLKGYFKFKQKRFFSNKICILEDFLSNKHVILNYHNMRLKLFI